MRQHNDEYLIFIADAVKKSHSSGLFALSAFQHFIESECPNRSRDHTESRSFYLERSVKASHRRYVNVYFVN